MTAITLETLPLGYRFHPTDEELVNHYLKRKINGRIKSEAEVIPEVDVCKCEPWDLPDKSIIRSDDLEWFFFAPKNRKYANGRRSNRATEAGYWKATGADRNIRSKAAAARDKIIGMKKTLVFHRGRAPNGIRTGWIMHEYRTTEPEFESGVQGGYVLYKLFQNTEEKSPNRKAKADEMERGDFSPTPTKSSPDDTQQEAYVMEATMLNRESPESEHQYPPDLVEEQLTDSVKPDESSCSIALENHGIKTGVHFHDSQYEQVDSSGFPNISSLVLPNTDDPFSGVNQEFADDSDPDFWNELVNELLANQDEHSSGTSNVQKDSVAETLPRNSIRDSASCLDSAASSDLDIEAVLPQELLGLGVSNLEDSSFMFNDPLQMNVDEFLEMEQWGLPFENASFLQYDNTGPDVYSLDSTAESLQDLCSGMEETSNQKNVANNGDGLEVTGIIMRTRQPQHPSNSNVFAQQGTATRRIRLQEALLFSNVNAAAASQSICSKDDDDDTEASRKASQDLFDSTEESLSQKNTPINGDVLEGTGIEIRSRHAHYPSLNKVSSKQGTAARRIRLQSHIKMKSFSSTGGQSSSSKDDHEDKESMTESLQAGEHADANVAEVRELPKPAFPDKLEQSSVHDNAAHGSEWYQESKPMLRLRARCVDDDATLPEGPPSRPRFPSTASLGYVIWLVLSVILLLMCVLIWRCKYSHSM